MEIGQLDRRVVFKRKRVTRDPTLGSEVVAWDAVFSAWAQVKDVPDIRREGSERQSENQRVQITRTQIHIRYRTDITADMRVGVPGRPQDHEIVGISEIDRRRFLELTCELYSV